MIQRPRVFAGIVVVVAAAALLTVSRGAAQDCCRIQTDTCCNRATTTLPCEVCDPGWPASQCCALDIGQRATQTVQCTFTTGWHSGTFWSFTRYDGCIWGRQHCDIDQGCVWDLQYHYADCSDYGHDPGMYDCPIPPQP